MKSFAFLVAARLKAEIPGLMMRVDYDIVIRAPVLRGRYACPCGEISGFSQAIHGYDLFENNRLVRHHVEHIKHMLREHVRGEGNEPNF